MRKRSQRDLLRGAQHIAEAALDRSEPRGASAAADCHERSGENRISEARPSPYGSSSEAAGEQRFRTERRAWESGRLGRTRFSCRGTGAATEDGTLALRRRAAAT